MGEPRETLLLDTGAPFLWRVGALAVRASSTVCPHCDDVHLALEIFPSGDPDDGVPLRRSVSVGLEPWTVRLDAVAGGAAEMDGRITALLEKHRDELALRGRRMLRARDRSTWRAVDFDEWIPGALVSYRGLFPSDFDLLWILDDTPYLLEDYHCIVEGCPCTSVAVVVSALPESGTELDELGSATFDIDQTADEIEGEGRVVDLVRTLFVETDMLARLAERREACRAIAPAVSQRLGVRMRGRKQRDTPKVGRNDPCPCGSGKKHKKCCLDKV